MVKGLKNENGFTLLEMILVLAMFVILIGLVIINIKPYNERNSALQIRSEAQLALDTTSAYVNSTSNFRQQILSAKLEKVLPGYSNSSDPAVKKRYEIQTTDAHGNSRITVYLYVEVNGDLLVKCTIDPQVNTIHLEGIGNPDSVDSLIDSGVLDA